MHLIIRNIIIFGILIAGFLVVSTCKKDEVVSKPVIHLTVSPSAGNTTQTFTFDLSHSESKTGKGNKLFSRWDWDGNGIWDTPFTRMLVYEHRYFALGSWKPRVEMLNLDGEADTLSLSIVVAKGYSAPKPIFKITPSKGHIFTSFLLDASATHDDEDSLNQLSFRWDFEGDGEWDTSFGDSVKIFHQYPEIGSFEPRFQVRDISEMISEARSRVNVSLEDPRLLVSFRCLPDSVTNDTPIIMDASASSDLDYPDKPLWYRWDWDNDQIWDTEWLSNPKIEHIFEDERILFVRLQVRSFRNLTNESAMKIRIYHRNEAPSASFTVSTLSGNINTNFRFDCWPTRDLESSPSAMLYRWDFDGDGSWDTEFQNSVVTMHQYNTPGTYRSMVQVQDPLGAQDTCSKLIYISHGTNKTEIYLDTRGIYYEYYGTVLIGNQWWFSRNLSIHDTLKYDQHYYNTEWSSYYDYGNLYTIFANPVLFTLRTDFCPAGWRLPSREDWNILFSNYSEDHLFDALISGGESDFGAIFGGMGEKFATEYLNIDHFGYYWTSTQPMGGSSPSIWIISFDRSNRQVLKGFNDGLNKWYSVRCVKDN